MKIALTTLLVILLIRLLFRKVIDLPAYKGRSILSDSELENLMPEHAFWELIRSSNRESRGHYQKQCQILREKLENLPSKDIVAFQRTFTALMAGSYSFNLWEAAYALNGGCSDDCFEYFRSWLIAQGRNKFYWTLKYPRILLLVGVKEMIEQYEGIADCAYEAYQHKTGSELAYPTDITYPSPGSRFRGAFWLYPELALLAW
jgi:hypothetical protein